MSEENNYFAPRYNVSEEHPEKDRKYLTRAIEKLEKFVSTVGGSAEPQGVPVRVSLLGGRRVMITNNNGDVIRGLDFHRPSWSLPLKVERVQPHRLKVRAGGFKYGILALAG